MFSQDKTDMINVLTDFIKEVKLFVVILEVHWRSAKLNGKFRTDITSKLNGTKERDGKSQLMYTSPHKFYTLI